MGVLPQPPASPHMLPSIPTLDHHSCPELTSLGTSVEFLPPDPLLASFGAKHCFSLCMCFYYKMRGQIWSEMQVGSGCPELPVRCCLQLDNKWLQDREDKSPEVPGDGPALPIGPCSISAICCPLRILIHILELPGNTS